MRENREPTATPSDMDWRPSFPRYGHTEKVERVARAICKDDTDPLKYVETLIIAESQIARARVCAARVAALEGAEKERENERSSKSDSLFGL
jgi:hypothetical protein